MNDNENLKSLYNTLQKEGYTPPAFEQFAKDMEDDGNLRGVYSTLQNEGYTPPDYDTFRNDMGFGNDKSVDLTAAKEGSEIGANAITNIMDGRKEPQPGKPKAQAGSHAQMVVDEYDRAAKAAGAELTGNNEKLNGEARNEANEPNRTDKPNKANGPDTPRMQFVPEAENVVMATPTAETLKKYPWLKADEAVPFDRNTGEPLHTWVDEQGNPISQRDLDVRRAKEEITGEKEYMQKTPASLQLPGGTTRGVRLDGSISGYVDNMMKQQYGDDYLNGQYTTKDGRLVSGAEYLNEKAQETYDQLNKEMDEARMSYIGADEEKRKELVDALANKYDGLLTRDTIQRAMDDEQAQEEAKATKRERERAQLDTAYDTAYARRAEAMNENMRKAQEEYENSSWLDRMFGGNPVQRAYWANQNDRRIQIADTQMNIVLDARKIIDAGEAYGKGETWAGRLVRGMGDALTDTGLYDSGVEDMHDLRNVKNALDAYEAGTATKEQKELLDVYALLHTAQGENADAMGGWYGAGGTTVQALPFMAQMAINPASNLGSATMKAATKWGVKQFGKTAMNKYLKRMFVTSLKAGGRVTGDALAAVLPAFTFGSPAITADTYDRLIGNVHGTEDEAGNIIYKNRSDFETSKGAAIAKAAGANLLEYQSEMAGPYFGALSKIAKTGTLKGLEKIGLEKTRDFLTRFSNKDFYRAYASFARKTQWHGTFEEYLEEVYNNVANAIFIGDMDFSTGDNGVFNLEMNLDTLLGVAVMSGAMSTLKTVDYARTRGRIKDELDEAYKSGLDIFGTDEWERITDRIDGLDDDKAASEIRKIISGVDGKERKHAVVNYAAASFMNQGLNMGELKNSLEQISDAAVNGGVPKDAIPGIENLTPEEQQNVHEDGMIHTALLYPTAENGGEPQEVFITKGNVVMRGDGTIDTEASSDAIYYKGSDGQVHMTSPDKIQSVNEPISVEEYAAAGEMNEPNMPNEPNTTEGFAVGDEVNVNIDDEQAAGEITGMTEDGLLIVSYETPDGTMSSIRISPDELRNMNRPNDEQPPMGGAGAVVEDSYNDDTEDLGDYFDSPEEASAKVKEILESENSTITELPDGKLRVENEEFAVTIKNNGNGEYDVLSFERTGNNGAINNPQNGNIEPQNIPENGNIGAESILEDEYSKFVDTGIVSDEAVSQIADKIINGEQLTPEEESMRRGAAQRVEDLLKTRAATKQEGQQTEAHPTAMERIPKDEKGKPAYERADPETAWDAIMEKTEGDEEMAKNVADAMVKQQETELEKLKKKQPKAPGGDVDAMIAAQKQKKAAIAEAQEKLDKWKMIAGTPNRRKAAATTASEQAAATASKTVEKTSEGTVQPAQEKAAPIQETTASQQENAEKERYSRHTTAKQSAETVGVSQEVEQSGTEQGTEVPAGVQGSVAEGAVSEETPQLEIEPIGVNRFGNIYNWAKGQFQSAASFLNNLKSGYLRGVFYRDDIGNIDMVWGNEKAGLQHIINKHIEEADDFNSVEEAMQVINDTINNGTISQQGTNISLDYNGYRVSIAQSKEGNWVLTAFDKTRSRAEKQRNKRNATIGDQSVSDMENGTLVSPQLASSESKDTQTSANEQTIGEKIAQAEAETDTEPTEAQKEADNYKKGHVKIDGFDVTIENPKGSVRSGKDADGTPWSVTMNNTYGYIRGTEGVDGDHIDVYLSDNPTEGNVFVIDQVNSDGSFDEHKVMYGFNSAEEARDAYLANYSPGWQGLGTITEVTKDEFKKWVGSSHRKTKPFAEYKIAGAKLKINDEKVNIERAGKKQNKSLPLTEGEYANKRMKELMKENPQIDEDDAENQALDEYPSYIGEKIKSGEIESLYAQSSISDRIKLGKIVEAAGFEVSDISGTANKERQEEKRRNIRRVGEKVSIEYLDGTTVTGEITRLQDGDITVKSKENGRLYTVPERNIINVIEGNSVRLMVADEGRQGLSPEEAAIRDAVVDRLRESGLEVITDAEEGQRVLDEANGRGERVRTQAMLDGLTKAADFIAESVKGGKRNQRITIELPTSTIKKIRRVLGRDFDSHNITANSIVHAKKNHGVNGGKITGNSIPLRDEDFSLAPYIMTAPDVVEKGSMDAAGRESIRFKKNLSNGYVVVVEKEQKNSPDDMETITMWAELSSSNVSDARTEARPLNSTSQPANESKKTNARTVIISSDDAAKIRKDAETAIENDGKIREHRDWKLEESGRQYEKAKEVLDALHKAGFKDFYISRSITDFGVSTYIQGQLGLKFRISDHSVTSTRRILEEDFFDFTTPPDVLVSIAKERKKEIDKRNEIINEQVRAEQARRKAADEKWERIKKNFDGYVFKKNNRTYQDFKTFSSKGQYPRLNVLQKNAGGGAFSYEWAEPTEYDKFGYPTNYGEEKPSVDFIEAYDESSGEVLTTRYHKAGHVRFFRTADGEAYGFTVGGKIYIDPRVATADTPIHEYAHLWASALRQGNQEEWRNVVGLMKGTPVWEEVKRKYPELTTDDEIADEVLATYSGRRGAERLKEEARKATSGKPVTEAARAVTAIGRVREALRKFWQNVADFLHIHYTSAEEVADRVMRDLLEGVNPAEVTSNNEKSDSGARNEADTPRMDEVNRRFNDELDAFKKKTHKGLLHLGKPGNILKACGINAELTLSPTVLSRKLKQHNLSVDDLKGLAGAVQEPILVYRHGDVHPNMVIVTDLAVKGGKLSVAVELDAEGNVVELNNISSVHNKEASKELERLSNMRDGYLEQALRWVNKKKVLDWLGIADLNSPIHANNPKLVSVANIVKIYGKTSEIRQINAI